MGFRFRKSIKIAPGIRLNLSKSGVSTSIGVRGLTWNSRGRATASIPGSGVSFSAKASGLDAPSPKSVKLFLILAALGFSPFVVVGLFAFLYSFRSIIIGLFLGLAFVVVLSVLVWFVWNEIKYRRG